MNASRSILGCILLTTIGTASAADLQKGIADVRAKDYPAALAAPRANVK